MEALRDEYERQRRIQAQAQSREQQEQKGQPGGGVVEALREVRTRSKADEWLLRLAKASPLKTEN
jgi:urease accessory protein UreF